MAPLPQWSPFENAAEGLLSLNILSATFSFPMPSTCPPSTRALITHMLARESSARPHIEEVVASLETPDEGTGMARANSNSNSTI